MFVQFTFVREQGKKAFKIAWGWISWQYFRDNALTWQWISWQSTKVPTLSSFSCSISSSKRLTPGAMNYTLRQRKTVTSIFGEMPPLPNCLERRLSVTVIISALGDRAAEANKHRTGRRCHSTTIPISLSARRRVRKDYW